jgi:hypothetical protein
MTAITAQGALTALGATPDPSEVGPGLLGFVVMFGLALAVLLLVRSMVGHLRKVRYSVPPGDTPATVVASAAETDVPPAPQA